MKLKLTIGVPYFFRWNDTYSNGGWFTTEEITEKTLNEIHQSVGIFVGETDIWYIIATHHNKNPNYKTWGDINWIPKGCVVNIKELKTKK